MGTYSYLNDKDFLKSLDVYNNKFFWVKIEVLNSDEKTIKSIEGRAQPGSSISLNGSSSVRRTCNINIIAEEKENDLTDIDNLLSANKKVKIFEGIRNDINNNYEKIIWFPLGIFVITQPSITHSVSGCTISLACKDKMCLLNGECAGGLPTSIIFHEYDQIIGLLDCGNVDPTINPALLPNSYTIYKYNNKIEDKYYSWSEEYGWHEEIDASSVGERTSVPQRFYDIIQTLVCNYGKEDLSRIFINDVPLEIKQIVRYTGSGSLYFNAKSGVYTLDENYVSENQSYQQKDDNLYSLDEQTGWRVFNYNDDVGYVYTSFTYPGSLVSSIGDNICTILDKIKNTLGNYEYFYDVEGNFVFQEIKNYLNNSYDPINAYRLDNNGRIVEIASDGLSNNEKIVKINENGLTIIDNTNYKIDFHSNTKSVYTFSEGNGLVTSYSNVPNYNNLKNDFHIWGENDDGYAIHYHLAIKNKPTIMNTYKIIFLTKNGEYTGGLRLAYENEEGEDYIPEDWRAELYLQGLTAQKEQRRPDVYQQELLDLFDMIYNFYEPVTDINGNILYREDGTIRRGKFKADLVYHPNDLSYFFDYIEPSDNLYDCSVDILGIKIYSYQQDKINRLYNLDIPDLIMIDTSMDSFSRDKILEKCVANGQAFTNVSHVIYSKVAIGTAGYTAQETARDLLYQYTDYNESITIQSIPIYYLDVNTRITVQDKITGIHGDYIINSISLPLDAGSTMSITASRALERI